MSTANHNRSSLPNKVEQAIQSIPLLCEYPLSTLQVTPLHGGYANETFTITTPHALYVLRLPGLGTDHFINHPQECLNLNIAIQHQLAPPYLYFDSNQGIMLSPFLTQPSLTPEIIHSRDLLINVIATLKSLHSLNDAFQPIRHPDQFTQSSLERAHQCGAPPLPALQSMQSSCLDLAFECTQTSEYYCPIHMDMMPEHCFVNHSTILLIDWEHSCTSDAWWDLACLSTQCNLSPELDYFMLAVYLDEPVTSFHIERLHDFKILLLFNWAHWNLALYALRDKNLGYMQRAEHHTQNVSMLSQPGYKATYVKAAMQSGTHPA